MMLTLTLPDLLLLRLWFWRRTACSQGTQTRVTIIHQRRAFQSQISYPILLVYIPAMAAKRALLAEPSIEVETPRLLAISIQLLLLLLLCMGPLFFGSNRHLHLKTLCYHPLTLVGFRRWSS
jgi:hypothetical protein